MSPAGDWQGPCETDVLMVGGGLAGTGVAHHLAKHGLEVMLIERFDLNTQASGSNSGSIHAQIPNEPSTTHGETWTRTFAPTVKLMVRSIALWQELGPELGVDLEVDTPGGLVCAFTETDMAGLRRKLVIEREQGLEGHVLDRAELRRTAPYLPETAIGGVFYPIEGKANPLLAAPALAVSAQRKGARILTRTVLKSLALRPGGGFDVDTTRGPIRARRIVNCAGAEAGAIASMVGLDLPIQAFPIQTSVTKPVGPLVKYLLYAAGEKLSLKQNRRGNLLIGGGWGAKLDAQGRPVADMISLAGITILRTWAAIVNGTADWKPLLGEAPRAPGLFLCFFPWVGFSAGPVIARAIGDLVLGRKPEVDLTPFLIHHR